MSSSRSYPVHKAFTFGGRDFVPGDTFDASGVPGARLQTLMHAHYLRGDGEAETALLQGGQGGLSRSYPVRKPFTNKGKDYTPGDAFDAAGVPGDRLLSMVRARYLIGDGEAETLLLRSRAAATSNLRRTAAAKLLKQRT